MLSPNSIKAALLKKLFVILEPMLCLLWPALKCGNSEESQHAIEHIVEVEVAVEPLSLSHHCVLQGVIHVLQEGSPESKHSK